MPSEGAMEICPDCCGAGGDNNTFTCPLCDGQGMVPATPPPASADALGEVNFAALPLIVPVGDKIMTLGQLIDGYLEATAALSAMSPAGEVERAALAERGRCEKAVLEQRCERDTPWDLAPLAAVKAIREPKP